MPFSLYLPILVTAVQAAQANHPVFGDVPDVFSIGIVSHAVVFYDSGFGL